MSAREKILKHLQKGRTLTPLQAWRLFGTSALSQHVSALKARGFKIGGYRVSGERFHKYFLTY